MPELYMIKRNGGLYPAGECEKEIFDSVTREEVLVRILQHRNPKHHAKFFAMIAALYHDTALGEQFSSPDALRFYLLVKSGHAEIYTFPNGKTQVVAQSLKFASMDQLTFNRVYEDVVNVALDLLKAPNVATKCSKEDIDRMVDTLLRFI